MHIISKKKITDFIKEHPDSESSLFGWYSIVNTETLSDFNELRNWFPNADLVGRRTVFNISGNKYRLIVKIIYQFQRVYIGNFLTHAEYDKNKWKE